MQAVVLNGTLAEAAQAYLLRIIEKGFGDPDYMGVHGDLHRFRTKRKMGGICELSGQNAARQAELRDTIPHRIDL